MEEYRYVYLLMVGVTFLLWLAIFILRKDLRREMLVMTSLSSIVGISEILFLNEYWTPAYAFPLLGPLVGLEDFFLAAFFYGGIGSVLYQYISRQKYLCSPHSHNTRSLVSCNLAIIAGVYVAITLAYTTSLNIIYITSITLFIPACILAIFHPNFLKAIAVNGLLMGTLAVTGLATFNVVFPGFIAHTWNLDVLSGILVFGVPIEEFLLHFAAGACFAVTYECLFNCKPLIVKK